MSSDVGLTSALRSNIASLQNTKSSSETQKSADSASSSYEVSQNLNDVINSQSLSVRANELQGVLDGINQSVKTLEVTSNALSQLSSLLNEAEQFSSNILVEFQKSDTSDAQSFSALNQSISAVLNRIDEIVGESAYKGKNLLEGDTLETSFNAGRPLITTGLDVSTRGLDIPPPPFTSGPDIEVLIAGISAAQIDVTELTQFVNEDLAVTQTRRDFAQESVSTLGGGTDLQIYDQDEEAANLLALQTRQALSDSDVALAAENQKSLFKLF